MENPSLTSIEDAVVDDVVTSAMSMLVNEDSHAVIPSLPDDSDDLTVAVWCDSNQQSAIVLRCSYSLASKFSSRLLDLEQGNLVEADVLDATGELVNVIAGNLRGLIACPGSMTTPFFVDKASNANFSTGAHNAYHSMGGTLHLLRV